jgi:deoxyribodipyrimidine photo-lyase
MAPSAVPSLRIRRANDAPVRPDGAFVLYWMTMARRVGWNFALDRALEWVRKLDRPLVILEALRVDYPWASERLHRFILDDMADTARRLRGTGVTYYPYVDPERDAGKGLLRALGTEAAVVVTDEFPAFMLPHLVEAAARQVPVRLEVVDSSGLLPLRAADRAFIEVEVATLITPRRAGVAARLSALRAPLRADLRTAHALHLPEVRRLARDHAL